MINNQTCENCRWWIRDVAEGERISSGECHRYAPRPEFRQGDDIFETEAFWPTTESDAFCGEHEPDPHASEYEKEG